MFLSKYFLPTQKTIPSDALIASHQLMIRAGMIKQLTSGIYEWLPLGLRVLKNVERIVQEEMDRAGAIQVLLPSIQPTSLWEQSGRYGTKSDMSSEMLLMKDRHNNQLLFAPTAEEAICHMFNNVQSYKSLPMTFYQISWKFRDEIRPRYGVMRGREFLMKDAYSFDITEEDALKSYDIMLKAYLRAYSRMGLTAIPVTASSGDIGGNYSHEFHVLANTGESEIYYDPQLIKATKNQDFNLKLLESFYARESEKHDQSVTNVATSTSIEVGHLFYLNEKYSSVMGIKVQDKNGQYIVPKMGCYGIGVSRLLGAIIECYHDAHGIIWPEEVAPFKVIIANMLVEDEKCNALAMEVYSKLQDSGISVLYDDTADSVGAKFARMDLIGIPIQIIIGKVTKTTDKVEIRRRADKENTTLCTVNELMDNFFMYRK
jgi:prolyl-tRNA synthetase